MSESEVQAQIIKYAKYLGFIPIRMNSGYSGRHNVHLAPKGTPDLLIVHDAGCLWVEVKGPNGKLRDSQKAMHRELRSLGHAVIVARDLSDVKKSLDNLHFQE